MTQFCPEAVDAWVLPVLQGSFPFLGDWSHPSQFLTREKPPWLDRAWEGSLGLTVLSISEQEGTGNWGNG